MSRATTTADGAESDSAVASSCDRLKSTFIIISRASSSLAFILCIFFLHLPDADAAPVVLENLDISETQSEWTFRVHFSVPVRTLRHSPKSVGASIEVAIEPLGRANLLDLLGNGPQVLQAPRESDTPLQDVRLDLTGDDRPVLLIRFWRTASFHVESAADFRSITIRVARKTPPKPVETIATGTSGHGTTDEVMQAARQAMLDRKYDRAIALYTIVLRSATEESNTHTREALEYLGLARLKNGQTAHARAEYEEYLERFPNGEDSDRVRQRLAALATSKSTARTNLTATTTQSPTRYDFFGSIGTSYFRTESFADFSGARLADSSQLFDADVNARMRRGAFELRGRATGYLRYDIDGGAVELPSRVTRLYLEARDHQRQVGGVIGRQSSQGAGVLGRLDGITADWTFVQDWTVKAVAGFPLFSSVAHGFDSSQQVYGLSIEAREVVEGLSAELYGVGQFADGMTDRAAIGVEVRYIEGPYSAYGLIDFDIFFAELNLFTFSGSARVTDATTINLLVDYRYSPFLTARNALIGQSVVNLGDLQNLFSQSEIKQLARAQTPRVTTLTAGASHQINETLEVVGDFTASQIGRTASAAGIAGLDSGDWFFYYSAQLISWDRFIDGGSERISMRIFDGDRYGSFSTILSGRYPLSYGFRLRPEFRFEYRINADSQNYIEIDPGLRVEYRFRQLVFDADFVLQWLKGVGSSSTFTRGSELGYLLNVGLRYDF